MIHRSEFETACLWEQNICLDCGALSDGEPAETCPECGGTLILPARTIKAAGEFLEEIED